MAAAGNPAAYFTRLKRSSSTAATRLPSQTSAAEALPWYALIPRMFIFEFNSVPKTWAACYPVGLATARKFKINGGGTIRLGRRGTRGGTRWCESAGNCPRLFARRRNVNGGLARVPGWISWLRGGGGGRCASSLPRGA